MKRGILLWCQLFLSLYLQAQTVRDTLQIGEVEVFGRRRAAESGMKVSRPDSMAMAAQLTTSLADLLTQHTPVFIKSYGRGSQATASFRGTSASHTQLLWNGMNLNSPMAGMADLSLLPVFFIDEVTLLHGGSSLSTGSGALGGAIHLENKPSWDGRERVTAIAENGSFGAWRLMGAVRGGTPRWQSVTRIYHDASRNNFPFYNVGIIPFRRDTLDHGDYHRNGVMQEFYLRTPGEVKAALRGWFQQGERNLPQLMSYEGGEREEFQKDHQWRVQLEVKKYAPGLSLSFSSGLNRSRMSYFRKVITAGWVTDDALNRELSWHNMLKINKELTSRLSFAGSLEAVTHQVKASNQARDEGYDQRRNEGGLLLHFTYRPSSRSAFFLLNRTETWDGQWRVLIPAAGAEWKVSRHRQAWLKANFTGNYHKPSMNDLYWIPGGNPGLLPEKGVTGEISWASACQGQRWNWRHDLSFYLSGINDWIIWQPAANGAWYWEADNLRDVLSRGLEYDFNSTFKHRNYTFTISGNYALTHTTNRNGVSTADRSRGKQLIYIPLHSGHLHVMASRDKWSLLADLGYTGRRYTSSSNEWSYFESRLNPFWLMDLSLIKHFNTRHLDIGVKAKVENLLDANYQQVLWRPMPGRHYSLTLSAAFQP